MERIKQKISSRRCVGSVHVCSQVDYVYIVRGLCAKAIVCMLLISMAMFAHFACMHVACGLGI